MIIVNVLDCKWRLVLFKTLIKSFIDQAGFHIHFEYKLVQLISICFKIRGQIWSNLCLQKVALHLQSSISSIGNGPSFPILEIQIGNELELDPAVIYNTARFQ